jgi:hypothetical protein
VALAEDQFYSLHAIELIADPVYLGFDSMPTAGYAARVCTAPPLCRHVLPAYWSQAEKTEEAHGTEAG